MRFAGSGKEAVALAAEAMPDLIALNIMMAGMDGYAPWERLNQLPNFDNCPLDFLKIDGYFTRYLPTDPLDVAAATDGLLRS